MQRGLEGKHFQVPFDVLEKVELDRATVFRPVLVFVVLFRRMVIVGKAVFAVLDHNINLVRLLFLNLNASEHNTRLPGRLHACGGGFGHGGYLDARTHAAAH